MKTVLINGPSGSGKTTLQESLITSFPSCYARVVLSTDRPKRTSPDGVVTEIDGRDYHFLESAHFNEADMLVSVEESGRKYGISTNELKQSIPDKIRLIVGGYHFTHKLKAIVGPNLKTVFMNTELELCIDRMLRDRGPGFNIASRIRIFEREASVGSLSDLKVNPNYGLIEVHSRIIELFASE